MDTVALFMYVAMGKLKHHYSIFEGLAAMTNISRYDLPDPKAYRQFFRLHPLYDFPSLQSTCTFFR